METREWNEGAGDIWWREVAGPHKYVKEIARAILDQQCLAMDADLDDDVFTEALKDRISSYDCDCHYVRIAADAFDDVNAFTAFIAQQYAPQFRFDPLDESPLTSLIRQSGLQHYVFFVDSASGDCPWPGRTCTSTRKQSYRHKSYRSTWCQSSWKHRCSTSCPSSKTSAVTWSGNTKR